MKCFKCSFVWKPRVVNPVSCPRCKVRFDRVIFRVYPYRCSRCGYEWKGHKPDAKSCPKCRFITAMPL